MALIGRGTLLQLEISGVYTTLASRVSISGPSASVGEVDATNLDSSGKEYLPTIPDWGEITCSIQYDPSEATHTALTDLIATPDVKNWKLIFSNDDGSVYSFAGFLKGFNPSGFETESIVTADINIRISGVVTISV